MCLMLNISLNAFHFAFLTMLFAATISTEQCSLKLRAAVSYTLYACDPAANVLSSSEQSGAKQEWPNLDADQLTRDPLCAPDDSDHLDDNRNLTYILQCTFPAYELRYQFNSRSTLSTVSLEASAELEIESQSPERERSPPRPLTARDLPEGRTTTMQVHLVLPALRFKNVHHMRPHCVARFENKAANGRNGEQWCGTSPTYFSAIPVYHAPISPSLSAELQLPEVAPNSAIRNPLSARLLISVTPNKEEQRRHTGWKPTHNVIEVCAAERDCVLEQCPVFRPLDCGSDSKCNLSLAVDKYRMHYCWLRVTVISKTKNATLVQKLEHQSLPLTPLKVRGKRFPDPQTLELRVVRVAWPPAVAEESIQFLAVINRAPFDIEPLLRLRSVQVEASEQVLHTDVNPGTFYELELRTRVGQHESLSTRLNFTTLPPWPSANPVASAAWVERSPDNLADYERLFWAYRDVHSYSDHRTSRGTSANSTGRIDVEPTITHTRVVVRMKERNDSYRVEFPTTGMLLPKAAFRNGTIELAAESESGVNPRIEPTRIRLTTDDQSLNTRQSIKRALFTVHTTARGSVKLDALLEFGLIGRSDVVHIDLIACPVEIEPVALGPCLLSADLYDLGNISAGEFRKLSFAFSRPLANYRLGVAVQNEAIHWSDCTYEYTPTAISSHSQPQAVHSVGNFAYSVEEKTFSEIFAVNLRLELPNECVPTSPPPVGGLILLWENRDGSWKIRNRTEFETVKAADPNSAMTFRSLECSLQYRVDVLFYRSYNTRAAPESFNYEEPNLKDSIEGRPFFIPHKCVGRDQLFAIVGYALGVFVLLLLCVIISCFCARRYRAKFLASNLRDVWHLHHREPAQQHFHTTIPPDTYYGPSDKWAAQQPERQELVARSIVDYNENGSRPQYQSKLDLSRSEAQSKASCATSSSTSDGSQAASSSTDQSSSTSAYGVYEKTAASAPGIESYEKTETESARTRLTEDTIAYVSAFEMDSPPTSATSNGRSGARDNPCTSSTTINSSSASSSSVTKTIESERAEKTSGSASGANENGVSGEPLDGEARPESLSPFCFSAGLFNDAQI